MFDLIYRLPEQLADARARAASLHPPALPELNRVVVGGMGGSAIGGDILQALCADTFPVTVIRDFRAPSHLDERTLAFAVSYSGNTEETLAFFDAVVSRRCPVVCLTAGGALQARADAAGAATILLPPGYPPRAAIGYLFLPMLLLLARQGVIGPVVDALDETIDLLKSRRDDYSRRAEEFARELLGTIPILYATSRCFEPVAYRWRCQLNENAKVFAHSNSFPELGHNEIEGMGEPAALRELAFIVVLNDRTGAPTGNQKRAALTLDIIKGSFRRSREFVPDGTSDLARIFSGIMFGDLVSVHLARCRGVDPTPIVRMDELKRRLKNNAQ